MSASARDKYFKCNVGANPWKFYGQGHCRVSSAIYAFDVNKSGHLEADKLKALAKSLGMKVSEEEIIELVKICDFDKSGTPKVVHRTHPTNLSTIHQNHYPQGSTYSARNCTFLKPRNTLISSL
jgi:hypothetical protein